MDKRIIIGNVEPGALWKPVGYHQVTNRATLYALAPTDGFGPTGGAIPANTVRFCTMQAETTVARFTDVTGASPSTAVGQILHPGIAPMVYGSNPTNLQFWVTAGAVNILYYK